MPAAAAIQQLNNADCGIICNLADRLYPMLRQLLSSSEPAELNAQRWGLFRERYNDLVEARMNGRRGPFGNSIPTKARPCARSSSDLAFC